MYEPFLLTLLCLFISYGGRISLWFSCFITEVGKLLPILVWIICGCCSYPQLWRQEQKQGKLPQQGPAGDTGEGRRCWIILRASRKDRSYWKPEKRCEIKWLHLQPDSTRRRKDCLRNYSKAAEKWALGEGSAAASRCPKYGRCFGPNFSTFSTPGTGRVGEGEVPRTGGCWLYALTTDGCTQEPGLSPLSLCSSQTQTGKTTK